MQLLAMILIHPTNFSIHRQLVLAATNMTW